MPRATSRAREPVGITWTGGRESSPRRMTDPFPNCLSIWDSATWRALLRSFSTVRDAVLLRAAMGVPFSVGLSDPLSIWPMTPPLSGVA